MEEFLYIMIGMVSIALCFIGYVAFDLKNNWIIKRAKSLELRLEKRDKLA